MAEETDGVGETFDDSLRIALTVASQFGERIARLREQLARNREAGATQETRELTARFEAERAAARASLAPVQQPAWWDQARPEDIAQAHESATAWRDFDDVAREAGNTIRHEVQERYGIDVAAPGADRGTVAAALERAERDRADAAAERSTAGQELTAAQLLFAQANRHDREANGEEFGYDSSAVTAEAERASDASQERATQLYDSSERRKQFASSLESKGIPEKTIAARVLADSENAKHPREAVMVTAGKATKIRGKGVSAVQQRDRGGLSR